MFNSRSAIVQLHTMHVYTGTLYNCWMVGYLEFGLVSGGVFQSLSQTVELHLQLVHPTGLHSQHLHLLRIQRERGERGERERERRGERGARERGERGEAVTDYTQILCNTKL